MPKRNDILRKQFFRDDTTGSTNSTVLDARSDSSTNGSTSIDTETDQCQQPKEENVFFREFQSNPAREVRTYERQNPITVRDYHKFGTTLNDTSAEESQPLNNVLELDDFQAGRRRSGKFLSRS